MTDTAIPPNATACLLLADGTMFFGRTIGADASAIGEICFNTGLVGYQETLTDPSYAGQIITFTFPHIGNVGCNNDDIEAKQISVSGLVVREDITEPSNFRSQKSFNDWLVESNIAGISGVDTRALTRHIRKHGGQNAMIFKIHETEFSTQVADAKDELNGFPNMEGMELAKTVSTAKAYEWTQGIWRQTPKEITPRSDILHVIAIDYGVKHNILRSLVERSVKVTTVTAATTAEEILDLNPDGIFLSNGPGDPAATSKYSTPVLQKLIASGIPIFGICLGHQLLALALGGKTSKMGQGHRGANHPVKNHITGAVEITSQNHGFAVIADSLPADVTITHTSLFDGSVEGLKVSNKPVFSVQYHPEASPGPHDSAYLFDQFIDMIKTSKPKAA